MPSSNLDLEQTFLFTFFFGLVFCFVFLLCLLCFCFAFVSFFFVLFDRAAVERERGHCRSHERGLQAVCRTGAYEEQNIPSAFDRLDQLFAVLILARILDLMKQSPSMYCIICRIP